MFQLYTVSSCYYLVSNRNQHCESIEKSLLPIAQESIERRDQWRHELFAEMSLWIYLQDCLRFDCRWENIWRGPLPKSRSRTGAMWGMCMTLRRCQLTVYRKGVGLKHSSQWSGRYKGGQDLKVLHSLTYSWCRRQEGVIILDEWHLLIKLIWQHCRGKAKRII